MSIEDKDIHKGHRSRMRAKLVAHGPRIFDTYELLEMLLYYAIPYKDTNPIAKRLLCRFGSLDGVLRASKEELMSVDGIGEKCADLIIRTGTIMIENDAMSFGCRVDVFDDYNFAGAYLAKYLKNSNTKICIALLDNAMRLIEIKNIPGSSFSSGTVKPKYFIDAALTSGATVAIIAHVHEHGALFPTEGDMATDKLIRSELSKVGVIVAENYIVGGSNYVGLKLGLSIRVSMGIPELERFYNSIPVMAGAPPLSVCGEPVSQGVYCYSDENPLEELLALVLTREKAKAASVALLMKYGRFSTVLSETEEELCKVGGYGMNTVVLLKLVGYLNARRVTDRFEAGKRYDTVDLIKLVKALYIGVPVETVYMLSFDAKLKLIGVDFMGEGTVGASDIYPRKLLETAIKKKSQSVILAHNHPKGNPVPSKDDHIAMRRLKDMFGSVGINLLSHYIVADGELGRIEMEYAF
jgi:DNA repair protein RadC